MTILSGSRESAVSLPGRSEAERAIAGLIAQGQLGFVLAVVQTRRNLVEAGTDAAATRALDALALRLAPPGAPDRELFRWSGQSFVIVSRSLRKITNIAQSEQGATALFGAWPDENPTALFKRVDQYVAARIEYSGNAA